MAIKGYPAFPEAPVLLESHHQIVECHIARHSFFFTPLQRSSKCILQPQRTEQISQEWGGCVGNETSVSDFDRKYIYYITISDTSFSLVFILRWCAELIFSSKGTGYSKTFSQLTAQMTISWCKAVLIGNVSGSSKSMTTCQSVQNQTMTIFCSCCILFHIEYVRLTKGSCVL